MRVLILSDGTGWIVDRITNKLIQGITSIDFDYQFYTQLTTDEILTRSQNADVVHFNNWDMSMHLNLLDNLKKPFLLSIRSHRFAPYVPFMASRSTAVHVINPMLQEMFPNSVYIPDGIWEWFKPDHKFVVGFAGKADDHKGFNLIRQACTELGVEFNPAVDLRPEEMLNYYHSIDLLVSASISEGFCAPVMECLAMNKPVITTDVGMATFLNVHKIERSVNSIKAGIQRFFTSPQVAEFTWERTCREMEQLYNKTAICQTI